MKVNIGKDIEMDVDANAIPANVMEHVVYIGLRNILMDSHANATEKEHGAGFREVARAMAEKKLAAMMAGDLRANVGGGRTSDPVRREALRIATDTIRAAFKAKHGKAPDAKALAEAAKLYVADNRGGVMEMAKARVAEMAEAATDLDDLL